MNMLNDYLIVEKSALPDYFIKVVEARRLLESGVYTQVIDAVNAAGISRSTYYKYKDKILEPFEYINEQYTPYMQKKYGDDLISYEEEKEYSIGGKKLPAGVYQYKLGDYTIEQVRLYDSSGKYTVAYTAKYIKGEGEATIKALDRAVRYFQAADPER